MDTRQQQLALGNIPQPTLEQAKRNEGSICQTHHQVAEAVWQHHAFNSIIGGFLDIEPTQNNCFVIRIFGYSNTYTTCDDGYDDKAEFDRAQIARQIIQTATGSDIHLLSCDTESDHVRILLRIP